MFDWPGNSADLTSIGEVRNIMNQRTNGPVNAQLISWPSKAQNIKHRKILDEMTLTFNTQIPS